MYYSSETSKVIIECLIFSEIIRHTIILKYSLECTQLKHVLKFFSEEHTPETPSNKIAQLYKHCTIAQAGCIAIPPHYLKNYTPMFKHRYLPFINLFGQPRDPPPPKNDRVCDLNPIRSRMFQTANDLERPGGL